MSNPGADGSGDRDPAMDVLERAVDRVVKELHATRRQVKEAQDRAERSDQLLRQFVDGRQDPAALAERVKELEAENEDLRDRIRRGREGVDRILASIRFLEDRR
ncbi:MAG: hypothetical protein F4059_09665 [Gemmatimonadetes bacterium]|nr:hypothetical protein [Gemmatimonadota bacterium]